MQQFNEQAYRHKNMNMSIIGTNYLSVSNPLMPLWWALAMPGTGHIMVGKLLIGVLLFIWEFLINTQAHLILRNFLTGSFLLASHLIIIYHSKALEGIYFTCRGLYGLATSIINIEWLLFLPSIYLFAACDTYYHAIEMNQLFRLEQSHYLEQKYSFYLKRNFKIKDNNP